MARVLVTGGAGFFSTGLISENLGAFHKNKALNLNQHDLRRSLRRPLGLISARIFDGFALYGKRSQNFSMLKHILFIPMVM